jgi:HEAT repeat protein
VTSAPSPAELDRTVARLLDDLAHHGVATVEIPALGERAVEPLAHYLEGPPQSFPHARQLAVRLLGLVGGPAAVEVLRALLSRHDLTALSPVLAQSEYAVKDEAVVQLLRLGGADFGEEFLRAFRRDRLPTAAEALARCRVTAAIPDLIAALEDDLLAERAADALRRFGADAAPALVAALRQRHGESPPTGESRVSRRRRIAAATLLGELGDPAAATPLRSLSNDANPAVAAAAAAALAALDPAHVTPAQCRAIVAGAVSPEWRVRARCQEAAGSLGAACVPAAVAAVTEATAVDLYGVPAPVERASTRWLIAFILEHAGSEADARATLFGCDPVLLAEALAEVRAPRAAATVAALAPHPDPLVRLAAAHALARLGGAPAAAALLGLADDPVRRVRVVAARALRALVAAQPDLVAAARATPGRPGSRWRRWRLRWALTRARNQARRSG